MGTVSTWTAEALADQAALTTANVPANQVTVTGTDAYARAASSSALLGARGYELNLIASSTTNVRLTATSNLTQAGQFLFRIEALGARRFWTPRHASGDVARLTLSAAGLTTLTTAANAAAINGPTLAAGVPYLVDWTATVATTTTGNISVRFSQQDGTVLGTIASAAYNLGTAAIAFLDMGSGSDTAAAAARFSYDNVCVEDGRTSFFPPPFVRRRIGNRRF